VSLAASESIFREVFSDNNSRPAGNHTEATFYANGFTHHALRALCLEAQLRYCGRILCVAIFMAISLIHLLVDQI
jgi:hypothetical protein